MKWVVYKVFSFKYVKNLLLRNLLHFQFSMKYFLYFDTFAKNFVNFNKNLEKLLRLNKNSYIFPNITCIVTKMHEHIEIFIFNCLVKVTNRFMNLFYRVIQNTPLSFSNLVVPCKFKLTKCC